ncbi:MAG: cytochrome-c oxidase, cbb3-type subunit II, partial [Betaproteobacteria bacterium]|nr:cytochrome-c oxidase, cbb3-type subunit II [Betaproteobacteria bacterium]
NMPAYSFLAKNKAKDSVGADIEAKMRALRTVGVPYTDQEIAGAKAEIGDKSEMDVLVAYLQGLGLALKNTK